MNPATPTPTPTPAKPRGTRNVPQAAKALSELLDLAVAEWKTRPQLTLAWTTQPATQALADNLRQSLRDTSTAQDALSPQALRLAQLDELVDGGKEKGKLKYVRKALALQYDEENDGRAYYGEFGIAKVGSTYTLPLDRAERAEALLKLVAALPKHNLDKKKIKYGGPFGSPSPPNTTSCNSSRPGPRGPRHRSGRQKPLRRRGQRLSGGAAAPARSQLPPNPQG